MSLLVPAMFMGTSFLKGLSQKRAAKQSAAAERENAVAALVQGHFQQRGMKLDQEALLSSIRNAAAAGGGSADYGSPLDAYMQAARESELDIIHARNSADSAARAHLTNAKNSLRAGKSSMIGELLGGAAQSAAFMYTKGVNEFKPSDGVVPHSGVPLRNVKPYSIPKPLAYSSFRFG